MIVFIILGMFVIFTMVLVGIGYKEIKQQIKLRNLEKDTYENKMVGGAIVKNRLNWAQSKKLSSVYLLTTDAANVSNGNLTLQPKGKKKCLTLLFLFILLTIKHRSRFSYYIFSLFLSYPYKIKRNHK